MLDYRKEIDGLRAIAVIAVILFHADFLPKGYLGVDIFFVISGYLITSIINQQLANNSFSLLVFYERRIRRIVPMLLLISSIALVIGYFTLLPDDLENLSESVIATTFFSNNMLLFFTRNYWDSVNAFKPLMHTWSLGVEEQFYLIFPILLICLHKFFPTKKRTLIISSFIVASLVSNFIIPKSPYHFYGVSSRIYQFAFGALLVSLPKTLPSLKTSLATIIAFSSIILLILLPFKAQPFILSASISLTCALLLYCYHQELSFILENTLLQFIGKISYSLYLWHHLVFSVFRLTYQPLISNWHYLALCCLILGLSIATYYLIERPFRNKQGISTKVLLLITCTVSFLLVLAASYIYWQKGIVKNIPEMDIALGKPNNVNSYIEYNERVYKMDLPFKTTTKKKLLVIGNSYARDFVNMLVENNYTDSFEISFKANFFSTTTYDRILKADLIIIGCPIDSMYLNKFCNAYKIDKYKILVVGTKNFGSNINWIFNTTTPNNRCNTKTIIEPNYLPANNWYKLQLANSYVDLIELMLYKKNQVPVFTPDCKIISLDSKHLTQYGTKYLGTLLKKDTNFNYFMGHLDKYFIHNR